MDKCKFVMRLVQSACRSTKHLTAVLLGFILFAPAFATSVPTGFRDQLITTGVTSPTSLTVLPDGRVMVVQQDGVVRLIKSDGLLAANFYKLPNVNSTDEHGCLSVVADPGFSSNHFVYFYCTTFVGSGSRNRVIRVTEANDTGLAASERVIFELPDVPSGNHYHMGGPLRFGLDGKLYVAVGNHEDSPQSVTNSASQDLGRAFGKILRINKDGTVPTDNPYYTTPGAYQAIFAIGFRNPFVMDIQPGTGMIAVGDVGQSSYEEINKVDVGRNYGWPGAEGNSTDSRYTNPLYAYTHSDGCAITGVQFYNPVTATFPASYVGRIFFTDYCNGAIKSINPAAPTVVTTLASGIGNPTNIATSPDGALYYLARNQSGGTATPGGGSISKITYTGINAPNVTSNPTNLTVMPGSSATFSVAAGGASGFQWQRNGANISGATGSSYTLANAQIADSGARFRVTVSNAAGTVTSSDAVLTVTSNRAPLARIDTPAVNASFTAGQIIRYTGSGTDPEDGILPASSFNWSVALQHDSHAHAFIAPVTGTTGGSFTVPDFETNEANMWLRITLTVTDSGGATNSVTRDIFPAKPVSQFPVIGTPVNGLGPYEVDRSNGEKGAADGNVIRLSNVPYLHGLGVHAPSDIRFNLNRQCTGNFISDIGIDSESTDRGSVVFQVYLDNVKAYDSGIVRGGEIRRTVNVSAANKSELRLVVTNAGDGQISDHADWAGARVNGCSTDIGTSATVNNLQVFDTATSGFWSLQTNLQVGNTVYGDRAFTFSSLPAIVVGSSWIRTANDAKKYAGTPLVNFALGSAADVYVALDNRSALPGWVDATWADTGSDLSTLESGVTRTFSIFKKRFESGPVSLGSFNKPANSMYMIMVK